MTKTEFKQEMQRLTQTYGQYSYPDPVTALLWRAFEYIEADVFTDALDDLIANSRQKPMLKEITAAVDESRDRKKEALFNAPRTGLGCIGGLQWVAEGGPSDEELSSQPERKEWHAQRKSLLSDYLSRKITKSQFDQGCDLLDEVLRIMENKKGPCIACNGSGFVPFQKHGLHRCFCGIGSAQYPSLRHKPSRGELEEVQIPKLEGMTQWETMSKNA